AQLAERRQGRSAKRPAERRIGEEGLAGLGAVVKNAVLLDLTRERVPPVLHHLNGTDGFGSLDQGNIGVANADVFDLALFLEAKQRSNTLLVRDLLVRRVEQRDVERRHSLI